MIFTLEALQADQGDSLILHYGDTDKPRFAVIDGGPAGIYDGSLLPRLEELHAKWKQPDDKLDLEMVMVSHIDDDHILGLIELIKAMENDEGVPCNIRTFWYNSFDDILGNGAEELRARTAALSDAPAAPGGGSLPHWDQAMAVIASVTHGRELRARAEALGIVLNGGFGGIIMLDDGAGAPAPVQLPGGLKLHVAGPLKKRVLKLQKDWEDNVRKNPDPVVLASFADQSVPNLSSLIVVAEFQDRRMLLTGDARGDDVLAGLKAAGFLDANGCAHFDVVKMPHHGSDRNMTQGWLKQITGDHYVISADGQYENPADTVIDWICTARGNEAYSICLTNQRMKDPKTGKDVGAAVQKVLKSHPNPKRKVVFRGTQDRSVKAEVLEKVDY